ncbi:MAG: phytanoyl-CoA dioxygenase family protein, partial [Hyphomicrobiales bacterium]
YCNWQRIEQFETVIRNSAAAEIAAKIMDSQTAQFFHDHILIKEPGTSKPTPWHQDIPFYFVDGRQCVSFWIPLDAVEGATLRFIAGSHKWPRLVRPTRWLDDSRFYENNDEYIDVPDPEAEPGKYRIIEWQMQPGDAVLFDFRCVHGARANMTNNRRRAFSMRWLGDDMVYTMRPGRTSPPFPGHAMGEGQRLREDWFPVLWSDTDKQ